MYKKRKENIYRSLKVLMLFVLAIILTVLAKPETAMAAGTYRVSVASGYLALRTTKAYDSRNEIGELYTGDTVELVDGSDATYWYVYSPKHGKYGYTNRNYLQSTTSSAPSSVWTVRVASGYLALRTAKAYDSRNEIGQLYTGDTVTLCDSSDATYWYVYSGKLGKYGFVNKNYLYSGGSSSSSSGDMRTVQVASGYLALRTAKAYDSRNEIGQLYTGDVVQVIDTSDATYWYVYSGKLSKYGYVNKNYLTTSSSASYTTRTVRVASGYLALRSAKAYDSRNEIGQLYTGETVTVIDTIDATYWYVYSGKLGKYGYVNRNYLY